MKLVLFCFLALSVSKEIACGINILQDLKCKFYECCRPPYVNFNLTRLELNLNRNLFGQPLVKNTLITALKSHFSIKNPKKALVLSFHGSTGVGKNFVSQFIAESLFSKGIKSKYYKQFISTKDFPHNEKVNEYKDKIKNIIEDAVKECHMSLFVFDEIDKIPIGLMDTIKPYIDFNNELDGIDYRPSVFIFLSNSAAKDISLLTYDLDKQNIKRESFELKSFQKSIQQNVYHHKELDNKGLWHASIVDSYLIDYYVPFLPLERTHIKRCIGAELLKYSIEKYSNEQQESDMESVADEMGYEPPGTYKFSTSGCKRVPSLVRNLIAEKGYNLKDEL